MLRKLLVCASLEWQNHQRPTRPSFLSALYHRLLNQQSHMCWDQINKGGLTHQFGKSVRQALIKPQLQAIAPLSLLIYTMFTSIITV
jgi:hypothetical protein